MNSSHRLKRWTLVILAMIGISTAVLVTRERVATAAPTVGKASGHVSKARAVTKAPGKRERKEVPVDDDSD